MPIVYSLLRMRAGSQWSAHRIHDAASPRQRGGPEPHQATCARSGATAPGGVESAVVDCDQSAAEGSGVHVSGDRARDPKTVSWTQTAVIGALGFYKLAVSPWLPSACRFHPTCSEYMREAVARFGVVPGVWLGLKRLVKCHPFHSGGVDHIPHERDE
jgi:putative membrane protein insertion efficiency factor